MPPREPIKRRRVMHFKPVHTDKVRLIAAKPSNRPTVCEIRFCNHHTPHPN
jgi:di/tripeptidase